MGKIVITGVRGNFGHRCAETILGLVSPDQLIFTSSDAEALSDYKAKGVDCRSANFNGDVDEIAKAFEGADTVVLVSMPFVGPKRRQAHQNAIDAAVKAGASRIIYTSIVGAGTSDCDTYEVSDHKVTEAYLLDSPIHSVFMRNSQYAEAMVSAFEDAYNHQNGILANNMGDGKMAFVSRLDCADAAAKVATMPDDGNQIYYISGPEAMTMEKFCRIGSEATGHEVAYKAISDEENYAAFDAIGVPRTTEEMWADTAGAFPFCSDGMITFGRAIRLDQMSRQTDDFEKIMGREATSVKYMFEHIDEYRIGPRNSTDD